MNTSEKVDRIATALAAAQAEMHNPTKNKVNTHFRSSYVDLASGLDTIRPVLSKHGLSLVQMTQIVDGGIVLHTRLLHSSGQWLESNYPVVAQVGKHLEMMSALSWARRASAFAIVGVAGQDEQFDGEGAKANAKDEAEAYVARGLTLMQNFTNPAELADWWNSEGTNRRLHFTEKDDPLFVKLKEAVAKRGAELAPPKAEAAE